MKPFSISKGELVAFIILTALGLAAWRLGWDYLRSPHSEIVDFKLNPVPEETNRGDAI